MKTLISTFLCVILMSCSSSISGTYTITDYYIESSKLGTPQEIESATNDDRNDCLGTKLNLTEYDDCVMLSVAEGKTSIAKEIANIAMKKIGNVSYQVENNGTLYSLTVSGQTVIVKEIIKNAYFFDNKPHDEITLVFKLRKD